MHDDQCSCGCHHPPNTLRTFARRKDPTNTNRIRVRFEQEVNRRFASLRRLIKEALLVQDVMGLNVNARAPGRQAFKFLRSGDKVSAFMEWLKRSEDELIFGVVPGTSIASSANSSWMNIYLDSAYQRGLAQSAGLLEAAGVAVSQAWRDNAFFRPVHADRVGLIYTRVYTDLYGITEVMDRGISTVLARGLAEGRNPESMARDIVKQVDGVGRHRARLLARTEVVAAHAEASLNSYKEAGLEGVNVKAEWSTAGDDRVCEECAAMEGKTFSIDDSYGMIPLHPNCRCAFIPVVLSPEGKALI